MAATDNLHSLFVTWSKIILPLAGVALLSMMFLFARDSGSEPAIPFSEIEQIAREARISSPRFAGVTADGATISVSAEAIRPDPERPDAFAVTDIVTEISIPDGQDIVITAGVGALDPRAQTARMSGLARLTVSSGYVMETDGLIADLRSGHITSLGPLEVQAPFGALTAGALEVTVSSDGAGQRMVFNDGVRLLYQPQP